MLQDSFSCIELLELGHQRDQLLGSGHPDFGGCTHKLLYLNIFLGRLLI